MKHVSGEYTSEGLARAYLGALSRIEDVGFAAEIDSFFFAQPGRVTESLFLREYAWVVLNSGFRESVVRNLFGAFSSCFFEWQSAQRIVETADSCEQSALRVFGHSAKVRAIIDVARVLAHHGLDSVLSDGSPQTLVAKLPYIGRVTAAHLLKNLGVSMAKEDRHLARLATSLGFTSAQGLCECISDVVGHPVGAVDTVLWRFSTITTQPCRQFALLAQ